ncbi:hypothetical protein [Streptomyces eurythermus]|uniref:hypothetical protein n=1 Tax=Streptomyces eurythermus TaxID=42237 RepID=UPI0033DC3C30
MQRLDPVLAFRPRRHQSRGKGIGRPAIGDGLHDQIGIGGNNGLPLLPTDLRALLVPPVVTPPGYSDPNLPILARRCWKDEFFTLGTPAHAEHPVTAGGTYAPALGGTYALDLLCTNASVGSPKERDRAGSVTKSGNFPLDPNQELRDRGSAAVWNEDKVLGVDRLVCGQGRILVTTAPGITGRGEQGSKPFPGWAGLEATVGPEHVAAFEGQGSHQPLTLSELPTLRRHVPLPRC